MVSQSVGGSYLYGMVSLNLHFIFIVRLLPYSCTVYMMCTYVCVYQLLPRLLLLFYYYVGHLSLKKIYCRTMQICGFYNLCHVYRMLGSQLGHLLMLKIALLQITPYKERMHSWHSHCIISPLLILLINH